MEKIPKLIFLHNFRCAGNALHMCLFENYGLGEHLIKVGGNPDVFCSYENLLKIVNDPKVRFIVGHNVFGLHNYIEENSRYFVNVREPIERLISGYTGWNNIRGQTLRQWLDESFELKNGMTKRFCGYGHEEGQCYDHVNNQPTTEFQILENISFEKALANLNQHCDAYFIDEYFQECIVLFEEKFQLPPLFTLTFNHYNQSKRKLSPNVFSRKDLEYIIENNQEDYKLYPHIKKHVETEISNQPDSFFDKVRIRHLINSALKLPVQQDALGNKQILEALGQCEINLLNFGMVNELRELIKLIVNKAFLSSELRAAVVNSVRNLLSKEIMDEFDYMLTVAPTKVPPIDTQLNRQPRF